MTQLRLAAVKPRSAWIVGSATVTIVPSRMVMSDAVHKMTSASTRERVMRASKPGEVFGETITDYLFLDNLLMDGSPAMAAQVVRRTSVRPAPIAMLSRRVAEKCYIIWHRTSAVAVCPLVTVAISAAWHT